MQATILCYHKVGSAQEEGRKLNIEPRRLDKHVRYFSRKNYQILCAHALSAPWPERCVVFTFDDAYLSTMTHAPSIFEKYGARATFYAVAGKVGTSSDWDGDLARPLAPWDLLHDAQMRGHEIGNHSLTHPHMATLSAEAQFKEIQEAHERFVSEGIQPRSFCYPFGSNNPDSITQLERAGYKVGLALEKKPAYTGDPLLKLPRVVVAYSDSLPMLLYKMTLKPILRGQRPKAI